MGLETKGCASPLVLWSLSWVFLPESPRLYHLVSSALSHLSVFCVLCALPGQTDQLLDLQLLCLRHWAMPGFTFCVSLVGLAAMTENHRLGGFNSRSLVSHGSGGWKELCLVRPVLQAHPSLCPPTAFPLCACGGEESRLMSLPVLIKGVSLVRLDPLS